MKKFLSFLLAVLMVVGVMVPMLTFLVSAEGDAQENADTVVPELPGLIITEIAANAVSYQTLYANVKTYAPEYLDNLLYGEDHYQQVTVKEGASVTSYYLRKSDGHGNYYYEKATGTAVAGEDYYYLSMTTANLNEVGEYIEIYNSGTEAVNLYDYKIGGDSLEQSLGNTFKFADIHAGGVESSKSGKYFTKAIFTDGRVDSNETYYTKGGYIPTTDQTPVAGTKYYIWDRGGLLDWTYKYREATISNNTFASGTTYYVWSDMAAFTQVAAEDVKLPQAGVTYYTKNGEEYVEAVGIKLFAKGVEYYIHNAYTGRYTLAVTGDTYYVFKDEDSYNVVNPAKLDSKGLQTEDGAWLYPGETAVIWMYNTEAWRGSMTLEHFTTYHNAVYSSTGAKANYNTNLGDGSNGTSMVLVAEANANATQTRGVAQTTFNFGEWEPMYYGIVHDSVLDDVDTSREHKWTSWILWSPFAGVDISASIIQQEVGVDIIVDQTKVVYNSSSQTKLYLVLDPATGQYRTATVASGTANDDGTAKAGITYYCADLTKSDGNPSGGQFSNKYDRDSTHYLYGFDSTVSIKEGTAYTVGSNDLTPGFLNTIQKLVLPDYSKSAPATTTPGLVITEVMPDNTGSDAYEFVEIVNTAGYAVNVFDYSFGAYSSYMTYAGEYFGRVNPIVPGNAGNILAADPGSMYYDVVPTNVDYESGWLQPGEVAVLWCYAAASAQIAADFSDFRNFFDMDNTTKIFAVDVDNSQYSGRPNERQNLGNTNAYIYGMIKNNNMNWYGDVWTSNPIFAPITYGSGVTGTNKGIPVSAADSIVLCYQVFAACDNVTLGENYGFQFVWDSVAGTKNMFGAYLDMAYMTKYDSADQFFFTDSVVTEEWKASPGVLLDVQKTDMTTNKGASRYVLYLEEFNGYDTVEGYENVAELLGITGVTENAQLNKEHLANVKVTEKNGTNFLEIRDGKLYVNNKGTSDDYMKLMSDEMLNTLRNQNFTVEFAMTYDADSTNTKNGYSTILYNFDGAEMDYGAPIIRISGYGNNAVVRHGAMIDVEDDISTAGAPQVLDNASLTGDALTLYERLNGDVDSLFGFTDSLEGTVALAGQELVVRVDVSVTKGVTVTVNGKVVSQTYEVVDSAVFANWSLFLEETVGSDIVMMTTPGISVAYDYITVYTDSVTTNANDLDIPSVFITEVAVSTGNDNYYTADATTKYNLAWIEYIEIANGGTEPIYLKDYVIMNSGWNDKLHYGNNLKWNKDEMINLADWLGTGDYEANLSWGSGTFTDGTYVELGGTEGVRHNANADAAGWYNPSANEAVLQPGEVAVIFTLNGDLNPTSDNQRMNDRMAADGTTKNFVEAACSWLQIPEGTLCVVTSNSTCQVTDVYEGTDGKYYAVENSTHDAFGIYGDDNNATIYGVGRAYDAKGNKITWSNVYTHDYRNLESFFNYDYIMTGTRPGYSMHVIYGVDNSSHYKMGTALTPKYNGAPIITWYDGAGAVYKDGDDVSYNGQYKVGKLYPQQAVAFREMAKLATKGFDSSGGLVITEFLFDTADTLGGGWDAFEAMELTNTSNVTLNLYDYAIAYCAHDVRYGNTESYNYIIRIVPGCPVPVLDQYYVQLQDIVNPQSCMIAPGETVVIWVYSYDAYRHVNNDLDRNLTVEDFRNYYASFGNDAIVEKDENGEYKIKVITAAGGNGTGSNMTNSTYTISYGICKTTEIIYDQTQDRNTNVGDVVSYMLHMQYVVNYDRTWAAAQLTPSTSVGLTLSLPFAYSDGLAEAVDWETAQNSSDLCIKDENGFYSFASKPYSEGTQYYKLYYYKNTTTASVGLNGSYNFVYGSNLTSGWNKSALLGTTKIKTYVTGDDKAAIGDNAINASHTTVEIVDTGYRVPTIGYLIEEQLGMVAALDFTYVGTMEDGTALYFYDEVMGDLTNAVVNNLGSEVTVGRGETSLSFSGAIGLDFYNQLQACFGTSNVVLGLITARAEAAVQARQMRADLLEAAGVDYTVQETNLFVSSLGDRITFYGSSQPMAQGYYSTTYSVMSYVRFASDAFGDVWMYANGTLSQNVKQTVASALIDYSDVQTEEYKYEISTGKFSRYNADQIARLEEICAANVK